MQKCLDLARSATKQNAHAVRVKFDIYKFNASKILPALYGDKPSETSVSVSNTVVIGEAQLNALRGNLERARAQFAALNETKEKTKERKTLYPPSLIEFDESKKQRGVLKTEGHTVDQAKKEMVPISESTRSDNGQT